MAVKGVNFRIGAQVTGQAAVSSFTRSISGIAGAGKIAQNSMQGFSSTLNAHQRQYSALAALMRSYAADVGAVDRAQALGAISSNQWSIATERLADNLEQAKLSIANDPGVGDAFLEKFNAELERLTLKFNPAKAAAASFDASLVELNRALALGAITTLEYQDHLAKMPVSAAAVINQTERLSMSFKSASASADAFNTEIERLTRQFNPQVAEVQRLTVTMADLKRALMLGIVTEEEFEHQNHQLAQSIAAVGRAVPIVARETNQLGAAIDRHNRVAGSWNRGLSDTKRALQQTGFQVSDFFIQLAGGQNVMLAFVQQGGQIVQFFGVWGSLAAAAISVGYGLWYMFSSGESAIKGVDEALSALNSALSTALDNVTTANTSVAELAKTYGQFADEVQRAARESMNFDLSRTLSALREKAMDATLGLRGVHEELVALSYIKPDPNLLPGTGIYAGLTQEAEDLAASIGTSVTEAERLYLAVGKFNGGGSFAEMRDNAQSVVNMLSLMYAGSTRIPPEIEKMRDGYLDAILVLDSIVAIQDGSAAAAQRVNDEVSTTGTNLSVAAEGARGLAGWAAMVNANIAAAAVQSAAMHQPLARALAYLQAIVATEPGGGWLSTAIARAQTLGATLWRAASAAALVANGKPAPALQGGGGRPEGLAAGDGNQAARWAVIAAQQQIQAYRGVASAAKDVGTAGGGGGGGGGGEDPIRKMADEYATLVKGIAPAIAATQQFLDINREMQAAIATGVPTIIQATYDKIKPVIEQMAADFKSLTDVISGAFASAFEGVRKGTDSIGDAAIGVLNKVIDKTIELLMSPVFNGLSNLFGGGVFKLLGAVPTMASFEGGGSTGNGSRSGGLDGKGGFMAMLHPKETVTDHARKSGGNPGSDRGEMTLNVYVDGAKTDGQIMQMVQMGVEAGITQFSRKALPSRVKEIANNPRRVSS